MLDIAPMPVPSRCGRTQKPVYIYRPSNLGALIGDTATKSDTLTSLQVVPQDSHDYDDASVGSSGLFMAMFALYFCFCFVRRYKRKHGLTA